MTLRLITENQTSGLLTINHASTVTGPWTPATYSNWADLLETLQIAEPPTHQHKTDIPLIYGGTLQGHRKRDTDITARTLLTLDYDHASADWAELTRKTLTGLAWAAHTTWTHNPDPTAIGQHRWRLIMPLTHPHTPSAYECLAKLVAQALSGADTIRIGQGMHTPSMRTGYTYEIGEGEPLDRDTWERLHPPAPTTDQDQQAERDEYARRAVDHELIRLDQLSLLGWAGPPWDNTCYAVAVAIIELCRANWNTLSEDQLQGEWMQRAPSDENFDVREHRRIWASASRHIQDTGPRALPDRFQTLTDQDQPQVVSDLPVLDVTNAYQASRWLVAWTGHPGGPLNTIYRRGGQLVALATTNPRTMALPGTDTPAPLIPVTIPAYVGIVHTYMQPRTWKAGVWRTTKLPRDVASDPVSVPYLLPHVRDLTGTSQTPWINQNGRLICESGWDQASGVLTQLTGQLIEWDWQAAKDPDRDAARAALRTWTDLLNEFSWEDPQDQVTYLALALTPLIRGWTLDTGGRWPMGLITAHTPGSGKTLLANILQALHGGTTHPLAEGRGDSEEIRKMIMSVLMGGGDTGRIVLLDNAVRLSSSALDGLLTSGEWTDRVLGHTQTISVNNDKLWLATGNNLTLGGDLARRCVWVHVDPGVPNPERRTGFRIARIVQHAAERRAELLDALLTMIMSWANSGMQSSGESTAEDNFADWRRSCQGVLSWAGLASAETLSTQDTRGNYQPDPIETQTTAVLETIWHTHQDTPWTAREVLDNPELGPKIFEHLEMGSPSALGTWLRSRAGRWWGGVWRVQPGPSKSTSMSQRTAIFWRIQKHGS